MKLVISLWARVKAAGLRLLAPTAAALVFALMAVPAFAQFDPDSPSVGDFLTEVTTATTDIIPWWPVVAVAVIVIGVAMRRILPWAMKRLG